MWLLGPMSRWLGGSVVRRLWPRPAASSGAPAAPTGTADHGGSDMRTWGITKHSGGESRPEEPREGRDAEAEPREGRPAPSADELAARVPPPWARPKPPPMAESCGDASAPESRAARCKAAPSAMRSSRALVAPPATVTRGSAASPASRCAMASGVMSSCLASLLARWSGSSRSRDQQLQSPHGPCCPGKLPRLAPPRSSTGISESSGPLMARQRITELVGQPRNTSVTPTMTIVVHRNKFRCFTVSFSGKPKAHMKATAPRKPANHTTCCSRPLRRGPAEQRFITQESG
mmetsp:Transcript_91854/g.295256  ORF Transcript_91854/g.295256 Transcript_91854/m.295256 type:complete len:290 (+) Transcript_91854:94-963(+)